MGRINDALLEYLQDNERFADLFNGCCFGGKKVIEAESLTEGSEIYVEHDTVSLERKTTACGKKDDQKTRQRIRDLKKWFRSGVVLRVLAVENQEHVDYAIPWRLMNYDAQEYGNQTGALKRKNRREGRIFVWSAQRRSAGSGLYDLLVSRRGDLGWTQKPEGYDGFWRSRARLGEFVFRL